MARNRVKVSPKITSQSAGWMARVYSSVRSWRIRYSSTIQKVQTRLGSCRHQRERTSAEATCGSARAADIAKAPALLELASRVVAEDVVEGRALTHRPLQVNRCVQGHHPPPVHQGHPVAQTVGLVHVVRGQEDGHPGPR